MLHKNTILHASQIVSLFLGVCFAIWGTYIMVLDMQFMIEHATKAAKLQMTTWKSIQFNGVQWLGLILIALSALLPFIGMGLQKRFGGK